MLAAAAGVSSNSVNRSRQPRPNCSASMRWTSLVGIGGAAVCSLISDSRNGRGVLVGDGGLEHRQRLAELHRAALELAEHGEQLLGALGHELRGDLVAVAADQPAPPAAHRAPGHPEGQAGELGGAGRGAPWNVTHLMIVSPRA